MKIWDQIKNRMARTPANQKIQRSGPLLSPMEQSRGRPAESTDIFERSTEMAIVDNLAMGGSTKCGVFRGFFHPDFWNL